ncbi:hypothetical protein [Sphingomonas sp. URHD0057]|uniref:hypothetical protein n=1 Tax=Sphingomonas sp. URHD0057 TaxID=1380389 RepID=UPI000491303F|nr:hypothetical protein [Sphingomonas sp. URHD0057]
MPIDLAYLLSRAIEEEARAASADDEAAKDAHRRLAEYYRKCAEGRGPPPLPDRSSPSGRLTIF